MNSTPIAPPRPYRILRDANTPGPCAVYYRTQEARDAAAQLWADRTGTKVLTEAWTADGVHDDLNRGWGCDGAADPRVMVTLTLHIENHYELYPMVVTTPTVTVPAPPDEDSDEAAYSDWRWEHIHGATGAGRSKGNSSYFVNVTASDRPDLVAVGTEYEFGV